MCVTSVYSRVLVGGRRGQPQSAVALGNRSLWLDNEAIKLGVYFVDAM